MSSSRVYVCPHTRVCLHTRVFAHVHATYLCSLCGLLSVVGGRREVRQVLVAALHEGVHVVDLDAVELEKEVKENTNNLEQVAARTRTP